MDAAETLAWLERKGTRRAVEAMARYAIVAPRAFGVSVGALRDFARRNGKDHRLAADLWASGWYEARMLATMVDDPAQVTRRQMNAWAADFDNWAICDTACFHLFDRTPFAYDKAAEWARSPREFVRRAGFALMASLAVHDKAAPPARYRPFLALVEAYAGDERNFVKKGVSWALRTIGRRDPALHEGALGLAERLAESAEPAARWVGHDARRDLGKAAVRARLARRRR
jgi:3-methyladenine DNA glycosylase AlkD